MSYMHIENLYKNQEILLFKECYALEKIHGTSAHISWKDKRIVFFSGGEKHENFVALFNQFELIKKFSEVPYDVVVYGEAYGGKQQGMSATYGKDLKFVAFEVLIGNHWLSVPQAADFCKTVGIEFVDFALIPATIEAIDAERAKPSAQAKRNGIQEDKKREGIVLRPVIELTKNNGERIIAKHKNDEFMETKTPREVDPNKIKVLEDAQKIADEWVTEMRLSHVLQNFQNPQMENMPDILRAMVEDIEREAKGEIIESKEARRAITKKTAVMFKERLENRLRGKP